MATPPPLTDAELDSLTEFLSRHNPPPNNADHVDASVVVGLVAEVRRLREVITTTGLAAPAFVSPTTATVQVTLPGDLAFLAVADHELGGMDRDAARRIINWLNAKYDALPF